VEEPSIAKTANIIKYEFFTGKIAFKFTVGSGSLQINRHGGLILPIPAPIKSFKHDQLHIGYFFLEDNAVNMIIMVSLSFYLIDL
jgi:hypothetical protein